MFLQSKWSCNSEMASELHIQIEVNLMLAKLQRSVFYNEVELLATWNDFVFNIAHNAV